MSDETPDDRPAHPRLIVFGHDGRASVGFAMAWVAIAFVLVVAIAVVRVSL